MKKSTIEVLEFRLPDYAACYFINDDASALTDSEKNELDDFRIKHQCYFVAVNDDSGFYHRNDLNNMGADCSTFIAHKL